MQNKYNTSLSSIQIPTQFSAYQQTPLDGACELYVMLWGFTHTALQNDLRDVLHQDSVGNIHVTFKALNKTVSVTPAEIDEVLAAPQGSQAKEYNPSHDRMIIALGLAYKKIMSLKHKELFGDYGQAHGYTTTHSDYDDVGRKPASVADLLLNKLVNYLDKNTQLILKKDGSILLDDHKGQIMQYMRPANETFIICPEFNHAILYYYQNNQWHKFNNQAAALEHISVDELIVKTHSFEPIRLIHNVDFIQHTKQLLWQDVVLKQRNIIVHKNQALDNISNVLCEFKQKIANIGANHFNARLMAEKLLTQLNELKVALFKEPTQELTAHNLEDFRKDAAVLINRARPTLQRDLGWGDYLMNILKKIANSIKHAMNRVCHTHYSFFTLTSPLAIIATQSLSNQLR